MALSSFLVSASFPGRLGGAAIILLLLGAVSVSEAQEEAGGSRAIVPLSEFVTIRPFEGSEHQKNPVTITKEEINDLWLVFNRENLRQEAGPQFIRINTSILNKQGTQIDQITQYAFTFPPAKTPEEDVRQMKTYARQILQFGYISPGRTDSVQIELDTLPDWGYIRVEVVPDEEYTRYSSRNNARIVWQYRIQGPWFDSKFTLGIPKVIYDTQAQDTVEYGNASALLRFFYLDQGSGEQFPISVGIGLYGVSTPLDVSARGGGVVLSLYFDIIQFLRANGLEITDKANAGLEIAPFLPVERKPRVLLSARIGFTP